MVWPAAWMASAHRRSGLRHRAALGWLPAALRWVRAVGGTAWPAAWLASAHRRAVLRHRAACRWLSAVLHWVRTVLRWVRAVGRAAA
ncbi:MAG TPA: hypothetical protein VMA72_02190 [Streptosporangiaceae bacterium]|nr:hypothetical protein [Streptosporangiaceae bacterium]